MSSNVILLLSLVPATLGSPIQIAAKDNAQVPLLSLPAQVSSEAHGTQQSEIWSRPSAPKDSIVMNSFDNHPINPSSTEEASAILQSPSPIETKWLMELTPEPESPLAVPKTAKEEFLSKEDDTNKNIQRGSL